jgi:hypothetical protein
MSGAPIEMSESLQKALDVITDRAQQDERHRQTNRAIFMGTVVEGLQKKSTTGTFFADNPEAGTAHRVGLREGAAVVMQVIDELDLSLYADDHCINMAVDKANCYQSISLADAFAASINS